MNIDLAFLPLPAELRVYRDQLRTIGFELVRYSKEHARSKAAPIRHPVADYEFAIHKIETIENVTGQIYINPNAFYSSAERVPSWTEYYLEKEKPEGFGLLTRWFKDPVSLALTVVVPPFGLAILGMSAIGDKMNKNQQEERRRSLARLSEIPKLLPRNGA